MPRPLQGEGLVFQPRRFYYLPVIDVTHNLFRAGLEWPSLELQNKAEKNPLKSGELDEPIRAKRRRRGRKKRGHHEAPQGGGRKKRRRRPPRDPQYQPHDPDNPYDGGVPPDDDDDEGGGGGGGGGHFQ